MRLRPSHIALFSGLILPIALATTSLAETAPAPPHGEATGLQHPFAPAERRAHMAEHLTAVLQLQPNQKGALDSFLDSLKPSADLQGRAEHHHEDLTRLSTPERLDRMMARFDRMHARMAAHVQATKQFYAQLTPSQQKAFDALGPMIGHGDHGMMGHGMMGGHEPGEGPGPGPGGPGPGHDGPEHEMGPDAPPQG